MNKKINFIILAIISLAVVTSFFVMNNSVGKAIEDYSESSAVPIAIFYGQGCPHCAAEEEFLSDISKQYPLEIENYEIYFNQENRELFSDLLNEYDKEIEGVPTLFINDKVIVGFSPSIAEQIEEEIVSALDSQKFINPLDKITENPTIISGNSSPRENPSTTKLKQKITVPAVIAAAAVDAINPCAFAVLIILLTTILLSKNRKNSLFAGLAFSLSIFISYFLMGLGLYSAIQAAGVTRLFYAIVAVLAIIVGLFNLKDYFWYGKWFKMEVPMTWRPKMKAVLRGVTSVPGAFLIGFVISLFLLPCTSGPYIVILGLLAEITTRNYAIMLLLLYNIIFILPMILITLAIYFGITTTEKAEEWRKRKLKILHLIAGIIILVIGIIMTGALLLGYI